MARRRKGEGSGSETPPPEGLDLGADLAADPDNVIPFTGKSRAGGAGADEGAAADDGAAEPPQGGAPKRILKRFNDQYCVVKDGGKTWVFEEIEKEFGNQKHRRLKLVPVFTTFKHFYEFHSNEFIKLRKIGRNGAITFENKPAAPWWTQQKGMLKYEQIVYEPGQPREYKGKLNLWRGWGVEPAPGDWSLMQQHIREVVCSGVAEHAAYVLNWLAWSVQNPGEPAEVALVFRGKKGTGKGVVGNALVTIFGQHGFATGSADDLIGKFRGQLRNSSFCFLDEAPRASDMKSASRMNNVISEPTLNVESKNKDAVQVRNCMHIIMASNEDWVIPATDDERRYMVLDVSPCKMQDQSYFAPLFQQMNDQGCAAMLHDLLAMDLGHWHPRDVLKTKALEKQQRSSLSLLDQWLLPVLTDGVLPGHHPHEPEWAFSTEHECFRDWEGFATIGRQRPGILDEIKRAVPSLQKKSAQHITTLLKDLGFERGGQKKISRQVYSGWRAPSLATMRAAFAERYPWAADEFDAETREWVSDLVVEKPEREGDGG